MRISYVKVTNYRNIDGLSVFLHPECNYIIGENNLGKSNFLSLLDTVCSGRGFDDQDYSDPDKPIEVAVDLRLIPDEQGFFGENFAPDDASLLRIRYRQTIQEAYPTIVSADSNESISAKMIRKINYLKYETTSIPSKELRLNTQKGAGLFINNIIERFIANEEVIPAFLNDGQISDVTSFINEHLLRIRGFRDYSIEATIAHNPIDMLSSLFYLSDGDRKIDATGSGIQYMAMASINILGQIVELYKSKSVPFENQLFSDDSGNLLLPLVLSIDEPEVHLHPYLQRSLIGYYKRILHNEDADFTELLKLCFGVDGLDGQLIIVTHSTDALVGDYRNLIRFYKNGEKTAVISGTDPALKFTSVNEKHLIMHFPDIKEAFYSHCAVLIEGESEYGCIRAFADKMGIALDDNGICVINARGEKTINPLRYLLQVFGVPSIAIYDSDVKDGQKLLDNEFFTKELCFEIEIVKTLYNNGRQDLIKQIALELDPKAQTVTLDFDFVSKYFKKMGIDLYSETKCDICGHKTKVKDASSYTAKRLLDVDDNEEDEFCNMYSAWFMAKKGVLLGRIIGETLPAELIPCCYKDAIRKAYEVATNA